MKRTILPDTCLCAIVRDEMQNPAGGIADFVHWHAPFVEQAVIVDTGSRDGTREELERLQNQYPNLHVFDHKFNGYADARNVSLEKARELKIGRALVLDADERLFPDDFKLIASEAVGEQFYYFKFNHMDPDFPYPINRPEEPIRLLHNLSSVKFTGWRRESLDCSSYPEVVKARRFPSMKKKILTPPIKHYLPDSWARDEKEKWHNLALLYSWPPQNLNSWRRLNPQRTYFLILTAPLVFDEQEAA